MLKILFYQTEDKLKLENQAAKNFGLKSCRRKHSSFRRQMRRIHPPLAMQVLG